MNTISLLQVSESVVVKSAEMAEKDPHGLIITAVSVSVVFAALVILYFAYIFVGKAVNNRIDWRKLLKPSSRKTQSKPSAAKDTPSEEVAAAIAMALDQELSGEVYAAIGMAVHQYLSDTVHDNESYIITIRRK